MIAFLSFCGPALNQQTHSIRSYIASSGTKEMPRTRKTETTLATSGRWAQRPTSAHTHRVANHATPSTLQGQGKHTAILNISNFLIIKIFDFV
jgi:hypothetical protein